MRTKIVLEIGDKIIDSGRVYSVFQVKERKNLDGEREKFVYYKPYFNKRRDQDLVCSIPLRNVAKARIRKPVAKKELEELLGDLSEIPEIEGSVKTARLRKTLRKNDMQETVRVLKTLWAVKKDDSISFTRWKKSIFELAMQNLTEEIAFVIGVSVREAKQKVKEILTQDSSQGSNSSLKKQA